MKRPIIVCAFCVAAALALLWQGFGAPAAKPAPESRRIALIVEDDTGAFLSQLKQGAQAAAAELGDELALEPLLGRAQMARLRKEGAGAAILLCESDARAEAAAAGCAEAGLPLVCVQRWALGDARVASDERAAGEEIARFALSRGAKRVILLTEPGAAAAERLRGALDALSGVKVTQYPYEHEGWRGEKALEVLRAGACLLALGPRATLRAVEARRAGTLPPDAPIAGMDEEGGLVADLEEGRLQALWMSAPYAMGYVALQSAHALAAGQNAPADARVAGRLIAMDNLYDPENVKMAFPLLQ